MIDSVSKINYNFCMDDHLQEKCAVVGVWDTHNDVARTAYFALFAQQHRGQEQSGIAVITDQGIHAHKASGLVSQVYTEEIIQSLKSTVAIGHNRYSTSKGVNISHAQPVVIQDIALAHNGNLPSVKALESFVSCYGRDTSECSDSELMAMAIQVYREKGELLSKAILCATKLFTGSYSAVALGDNSLVAFRDPCGIRPLSIGILPSGGYVVASETCALQTVSAVFFRDVAPGEIVTIDKDGLRSEIFAQPNQKIDAFEFVYFARHDSTILGRSVYQTRYDAGEELAKEHTLPIDVVVPVPETSIPAALGYAMTRNIPFHLALNKNRYIHRTFIEPQQKDRDKNVHMKFTVISSLVAGKRVALIDDSIVRGTTSRQIIKMIFEAGAKEVHFLSVSPPVRFPDFYGIDTPNQKNLIAAIKTIDEIREYLGATEVHYLSLDGLVRAIGLPRENLCLSCFNGEYPIDLGERMTDVSYTRPDRPHCNVLGSSC